MKLPVLLTLLTAVVGCAGNGDLLLVRAGAALPAAEGVEADELSRPMPWRLLSDERETIGEMIKRREYSQAQILLRRVERPDDCRWWNDLGAALHFSGDAEGSLAALSRGQHLCPDNETLRQNLRLSLRDRSAPGPRFRQADR